MATDLNVCTFTGRVGQDPESKADGKLRTFGLAVTNYGGPEKGEVTMWLTCNLWGNKTKVADFISKGQKLTVSGSLENREYNDKWYWSLNVRDITLPDRPKDGGGDSGFSKSRDAVQGDTAGDGLPF
jgi:single-stranded DNA-binding protein